MLCWCWVLFNVHKLKCFRFTTSNKNILLILFFDHFYDNFIMHSKNNLVFFFLYVFVQGHLCIFSTFSTSSKSIWNAFCFAFLFLFAISLFLSLSLPLSSSLSRIFMFFLALLLFIRSFLSSFRSIGTAVVVAVDVSSLILWQFLCNAFTAIKSKTKYMIYFTIHIAVQRDRLVNHYFRKNLCAFCSTLFLSFILCTCANGDECVCDECVWWVCMCAMHARKYVLIISKASIVRCIHTHTHYMNGGGQAFILRFDIF